MKSIRPEKAGQSRTAYFVSFVLLSVIFFSAAAIAQPSGGPYGPQKQKYELPKGAGKIYYVAPDGKSDEQGETLDKPTTIEAAIVRAVSGDAIVMRGGTYRAGRLRFNQGITIQPYEDEEPILKGTLVADEWQRQSSGLWKTSWQKLFPDRPADWWRQGRHRNTPLHRFNNDMVFVDGRFLQSAGSQDEVDKDSFYIDYPAKEVYIGVDPNGRLVEITALDSALTRVTGKCFGKDSDGKGPRIRGITFTQYAFRAIEIEGTNPEGLSDESQHGKEVVGTTFENCTISFCSRVGGYLRGDKLTMRHCLVSDTSTEGIYILSSSDVLLEKNIFRRNNIENISGYFPAGVKIFNQCYRVTCRDNFVTDQPNSNGIWYDVGNVNGVFINNLVVGVGDIRDRVTNDRFWPSNSGFFFEISKGAICAGNLFVNCDQGIRVLNSSDVECYNNTLVDSPVFFGRTDRSAVGDHFGWHPSTGPDVDERDGHVFVNNLIAEDRAFRGPVMVFWQMPELCDRLSGPQAKLLDYNVFVRAGSMPEERMILWGPARSDNCQEAFDSPEGLHRLYPEFCANSRYFAGYNGPLFKNAAAGDYRLSESFEGARAGTRLPAQISGLLGWENYGMPFVGAYPPDSMDTPP